MKPIEINSVFQFIKNLQTMQTNCISIEDNIFRKKTNETRESLRGLQILPKFHVPSLKGLLKINNDGVVKYENK